MYNPYQQYESGNQQYYPSVPQQYTPQATPSFNCDMNAYGYPSTNAPSFNNQYCPPYYPSEAYNGRPNSMQSFTASSPDMYAASSGYYNYNSYVPNNGNGYGFSGVQPPIYNQNPVSSVSTSYPQDRPSGSNYSGAQPPVLNQNQVPSVSTSYPKDRSSDSNYSKSVVVQKRASSSYQSSKSKQRLPSPDSFIKECLSGRKSNERLKKEEMIENSIQKTLSKESEFRRNGESSQGNSNYSFVAAKKTNFKSRQRSPGSKDSYQCRKKSEFIKRWRYLILLIHFMLILCSTRKTHP